MTDIYLERSISNILIFEVNLNDSDFKQLFEMHCLKKQLFAELTNHQASFEEILEALEVFISTSNMDSYLLDIEPKLNKLCDFYGVPD